MKYYHEYNEDKLWDTKEECINDILENHFDYDDFFKYMVNYGTDFSEIFMYFFELPKDEFYSRFNRMVLVEAKNYAKYSVYEADEDKFFENE